MEEFNFAFALKENGSSDSEISSILKNRGVSPKKIFEIIDKLNILDGIRKINKMESK